MNNLDDKIKKILSEKLQTPIRYNNMINSTLEALPYQKRTNSRKIQMTFVATCCCAILITSVVFAKDITNTIRNFFKVNDGMDKAIENGYIELTDIQYIESNGVEVEIENYLIDDVNFSFTLDIKFKNDIDISRITRARVANFIITDEENRIIFCDNKDTFQTYAKENGVSYNYGEYNDNYIDNEINFYIKRKDNEKNSLQIVYNLSANKYPRSKVLNFKFKNINFSEKEISENEEFVINGDWNININVPKKFYNRECIAYKLAKCSKDNIILEECELYDTCMKFKFTLPTAKIYDESDSEEEIKKKVDLKIAELDKIEDELLQSFGTTNNGGVEFKTEEEYLAYQKAREEHLELFSKDIYIETEDGKRYYPTQSTFEDGGYSDDWINGKITYWQTFNLTKQEAPNKLNIVLKYNQDYSGNLEEIKFELER